MHRLWYIAFPNQCKLLEGLRILLFCASSHVTPFFYIHGAKMERRRGARLRNVRTLLHSRQNIRHDI